MTSVSSPKVRDAEVDTLRVPPHSIEAEQFVLGALLLDAEALAAIGGQISEDDFYRLDHKLLFRAIQALEQEGLPRDVVTISEWLENHAQLEEAGGVAYIASLAENTPTAANIGAHTGIVHTRSILRRLLHSLNEIGEMVYRPDGRSCQEILDFAEETIFEIADKEIKRKKQHTPIQELMKQGLEHVHKLYESGSPITGIGTGYDDLDNHTAGLQASDLIVVAGRPSMGKTAFAINIAETAALREKKAVGMFSMEMPGAQLAMRMMASLARIDQHRIRVGRLQDNDWPRLTSVVDILHDARIYIDDTPALAPSELRARCRRLRREHGLDLVIVDYLQLMQVPGSRVENRANEISEISRSLKSMAKELQIPVIVLSQLNRMVEGRTNKRPVMSDLRESGAIEQDADVILFIYRDEVYNKQSKDQGLAEIIIGKQRNGPIGTVKLTFLSRYTRFESYTSSDVEPGYYPQGGDSGSDA